MENTKEQVVKMLNRALDLEHAARIQYLAHAELMRGEKSEKIVERLKEIASDEGKHENIFRNLIGGYLDAEPSMGLAPLMVEKIFGILKRINAEGVPLLLVEQNARQALALSHRGYVLETGRITLEGSAESLMKNPAVQKSYLGIS